MKECSNCHEVLPESEFGKYSRNKDGLHNRCKKCKREYDNEWSKSKTGNGTSRNAKWRAKRAESLKRFKRKKGCLLCEENEPVALQFHHLDPSQKEINIGTKGIMWSKAKIKAELAKCVILCANCHAKVHAGILELPN